MEYISSNLDKFMALGSLLACSLTIRLVMQLLGQNWILTIAHTATLTLLPIITYTITSLISGNIALSLGMVGALSIVRFRNPVRSPLELSVYFAAITMGIAASVDLVWLYFLLGALGIAAATLYAVNWISAQFGITFFNASFSEGNSLSMLEVNSTTALNILDTHPDLVSKHRINDTFRYCLASNNFSRLSETEAQLESLDSINEISLRR